MLLLQTCLLMDRRDQSLAEFLLRMRNATLTPPTGSGFWAPSGTWRSPEIPRIIRVFLGITKPTSLLKILECSPRPYSGRASLSAEGIEVVR